VGVRRLLPIAVAVAVAAVVVIGLTQAGGKGTSTSEEPAAFDLNSALASLQGAPAPLAGLHSQANELIDAKPATVRARLRELRGHPVVVNKWASWCGPCRHEFPVFEHVATEKGKTVAFIGLNSGDGRPDAEEFLRERPLPYPSYRDPHEAVARALGAAGPYPITIFYDERGRTAFIRQGPYVSEAQFKADLARYVGA
jgi:thiol-disulfide isomerase/thioredoxin